MESLAHARSTTDRAGLDVLLEPRRIAVVGASERPDSVGERTMRHLLEHGFAGEVIPVNPARTSVLGRPCVESVSAIEGTVDLAVICVPASAVTDVAWECGRSGVRSAVIYATGRAGDGSAERMRTELRSVVETTGMRIVGPNTVGIRNVPLGMLATFAHDTEGGLRSGDVAIVAQSGGLGVYFGSALLKYRLVGTRYLIDLGDAVDVQAAESLEYLASEGSAKVVGLLLEGASDGRRLVAAVRRCVDVGLPVVAYKVGRTSASAAHVQSHTASLVGDARVFERALARAGATIATDEAEFMDALAIHEFGCAPGGRRLGVVTGSGGYAIMTVDAAAAHGMELPVPTPPPADLAPHLASGRVANPFDWASDGPAGPTTRVAALRWMLDQQVDAVLLWEAYSMEMPLRQRQIDEALAQVLPSRVPLFLCGSATPDFAEDMRRKHGTMIFSEPTRLVRSLGRVAPVAAPDVRVPAGDRPGHVAGGANVVVGMEAQSLLAGLDFPRSRAVPTVAAVADFLDEIGAPVFLKVESSAYPHKSEYGLIAGPVEPHTVDAAHAQVDAARRRLGIEEFPIAYEAAVDGFEVTVGAVRDPVFGPVVMVGLGGVHVEVFDDTAIDIAPVDEDDGIELLRSLRGAPILFGHRGRPYDVPAVARAVAIVSRAMMDNPDIEQIDVNPLVVRLAGDGAVAADVRIFRSGDAFAGGA